ncbi:hypothetical protein ACH44C_29340 [Streptomyces purpureus]|uniref:hypothetical protein n=1 Tax=Streptomyces purpureus TaxID=1951 RepID=UPI00378A2BD4
MTARLVVGNGGQEPRELSVEPWADVHWIPPKQSSVVVTHSPRDSWPGTTRGDEPFQAHHRADSVTVWANGHCFHISDQDGNEILAGDYIPACPARPRP